MLATRPAPRITTTAAEGLPRRRFTVTEMEQMTAAGIIEEDERIELIGGEIVPMSPKGNHHEVLKTALTIYWARQLPTDLLFTTETTFRLSEDTYLSRARFRVLSPGHRMEGPRRRDGKVGGRDC
jgi:Uma2 family endonuclease